MGTTVLVADPADDVRELVARHLEQTGHVVLRARTGAEVVRRLEEGGADVAVVEWILPDMAAEDVLELLRMHAVPVLILSARGGTEDRVRGLELGAVDYVAKPFSLRELELRVAAELRHVQRDHPAAVWSFGGGRLLIDQVRHQVSWQGRPVELTAGEWSLLVALASCPGRVFSRHELISWTPDHERCTCERTVDTHVMNVRHKIGDVPPVFHVIQTVAGVGYRLGLERDEPSSPRDPGSRRDRAPAELA